MTLLADEADKLIKQPEEKLDETDINLRLAFDMMDENAQDIDDFLKKEKEKVKKKAREEAEDKDYEYTSHEQNPEIAAMLKKAIHKSRIKLFSVSILAFLIFFIELATADSSLHLPFLRPGKIGYLYILIDLQLLYFIALIMLSNIKHGAEGIIRRKLNTDSFLVLSIAFTTLYSLTMLFTNPTSESLKLYSFPGAAAAVCAMAVNYLNCKKDYHCFRVLAVKNPSMSRQSLEQTPRKPTSFINI
jgi:cation transport ATPase